MGSDRHVLVLGGQRSGKSRFAEDLVLRSGLAPIYLATGTAGDAEMNERIARHRARRGPNWTTIEEKLELSDRLGEASTPGSAVLVDCLTLWLANLMATERDIATESARLVGRLEKLNGPVVLVSSEVGSGVIPENQLARRFADALGELNQQIANAVSRVVLMAAGQPLLLKPSGQDLQL